MADHPSWHERYSTMPLPASRHVPGRGSRPEKAAPAGEETFRHGVDLFNNGYWWEAHEAWEAAWMGLAPNSAERHGIQAMIQVANCFLKIEMGQGRAARALRADLGRRFEAALLHAPDLNLGGLALGPWKAAVDAYGDLVLLDPVPSHAPDHYPYIELGKTGLPTP
jgi:hypothetical protein